MLNVIGKLFLIHGVFAQLRLAPLPGPFLLVSRLIFGYFFGGLETDC